MVAEAMKAERKAEENRAKIKANFDRPHDPIPSRG